MTAILDISRKLDRCLARGAGMTLSADDLALLASIGLLPLVDSAKQKVLEEQARIRALRVVSIKEDTSGLTGKPDEMAPPYPPTSTSPGMTPQCGKSVGRQRAQQMFGRR